MLSVIRFHYFYALYPSFHQVLTFSLNLIFEFVFIHEMNRPIHSISPYSFESIFSVMSDQCVRMRMCMYEYDQWYGYFKPPSPSSWPYFVCAHFLYNDDIYQIVISNKTLILPISFIFFNTLSYVDQVYSFVNCV